MTDSEPDQRQPMKTSSFASGVAADRGTDRTAGDQRADLFGRRLVWAQSNRLVDGCSLRRLGGLVLEISLCRNADGCQPQHRLGAQCDANSVVDWFVDWYLDDQRNCSGNDLLRLADSQSQGLFVCRGRLFVRLFLWPRAVPGRRSEPSVLPCWESVRHWDFSGNDGGRNYFRCLFRRQDFASFRHHQSCRGHGGNELVYAYQIHVVHDRAQHLDHPGDLSGDWFFGRCQCAGRSNRCPDAVN